MVSSLPRKIIVDYFIASPFALIFQHSPSTRERLFDLIRGSWWMCRGEMWKISSDFVMDHELRQEAAEKKRNAQTNCLRKPWTKSDCCQAGRCAFLRISSAPSFRCLALSFASTDDSINQTHSSLEQRNEFSSKTVHWAAMETIRDKAPVTPPSWLSPIMMRINSRAMNLICKWILRSV